MPTIAVLVPIQALGYILWWAAGSYFGIDVFSSRSIQGDDGWCEPLSEGWGVHCWGDYYYPIHLLSAENPFDNSQINPYPAASFIPFLVFDFLGNLIGGDNSGVILYLIFLSGSITIAVWMATRGQEFSNRILLTSSLTWLAPPFLITMDRGNSVGFLVPILIWFFSTLDSNKKVQQISALVLASLVKPHFAVLALIHAYRGKPVVAVQAALFAAAVHLIAFFVLRPSFFPASVFQWISGLEIYQDFSSVEKPWPPNLSFAQSVYGFIFGLKSAGVPISDALLSSTESAQGAVGPYVLAAVILLLYAFRLVFTRTQSAALLLMAVTLGSATTFAYYAIVAVPILLNLRTQENFASTTSPFRLRDYTHRTRIDFVIWLGSIYSLVQFPLFGFSFEDKLVTSYYLLGGVWLVCFALATYLAATVPKMTREPPPNP